MNHSTTASRTTGGSEHAARLREQLLGVAAYVEALPRGPRAVLRRVQDDAIPPQVFWDIADRYGIHRDEEVFWLAVLPLMVQHKQRFDLSPGKALAAAGVSGARVEKWLRLSHGDAVREAGRLFTRVKEGLDWTQLAPLLRFWTEDRRRSLARQFFLSPEYRAQTSTAREQS